MDPTVTLDYPHSPVTREIADLPLPRVMRARQRFTGPEVEDVPAAVRGELERAGLAGRFRPGARVAITVGSRGIAAIPAAAATIVAEVRRHGGEPFIVPAMGSHGGATAEGQREILAGIGVTEESVGAPIRASMEVVELGRLGRGMPVYMDRQASQADAIILLNRIRPHNPWGHIGSGLMKVATIGLGKQIGCNTIHAWCVGTAQLYHTIVEAYQLVRRHAPIVLGVGIIDNAYGRPGRIVALAPEALPEMEPGLRREADVLVPRLPFAAIDVLLLDEMGKNTSPAGLDPLVIGRPTVDPDGNPIQGQPRVKRIVVLDLTTPSHGNAVGVGNADVITRRLASKIDFYAMYMNAISGCRPELVQLPMVLPTDREAILVAAMSCGIRAREHLRMVRARNTLQIGEFYLSEALVPELKSHPAIEPLGELEPLPFDAKGDLL